MGGAAERWSRCPTRPGGWPLRLLLDRHRSQGTGLLLQLPTGFETGASLPEMRNLDIVFQDVAGRPALIIVLRDKDQRELFETLCRDIVQAAELADDLPDAVGRMIRRTMRWHHLLRSGKNSKLSVEEQRGLIGELQFLHGLIDQLGATAAIQAWTGPAGSAKDFEMGAVLVEVRTAEQYSTTLAAG
ncbi:PD-(D/E)XK motif protein [Novosphingobium decolorationis]|uniref:PD-(D/E)XK motif protein n=1 Tax=Novosphingobium decolorationis TaxID=2698673 RepID=A0ABX8EAF9_9SPHN|nr:PD-(D/E)XK motif protein [Novosphingobium decolorationis]QVM85190.1 PD-(D/E)XK motif protein [Novosphingobium decolorationis]